MPNSFHLSISKKSEDDFNRVKEISECTEISASVLIMKGLKMYIQSIDTPSLNLIPLPEKWDDMISKMSGKECLNMNTLINRLNKKIMKKYASTNK